MGSGKWRIWRQKDAAVSFLENRTQLGEVVEYDGGRDSWIGRTVGESDEKRRVLAIWKDGDDEIEKLFQSLEKYQNKMEKSSGTSAIKVDFNVRNLKWEDVFGQISQAADQYESEGARGSKAEIKRTFRGICRNAPVIQQWLTLVPNGDYSSGIAGAFQMFAVAAQRSYEIRKSVREVMIEIPQILSRNRDYVEIYKTKPRDALTKGVAELFKAILCTLRLVIEYLTKSSTERAIKAVFRGDAFERELEEAIEEVRQLSDHTSAEANVCLHDRTRRIEEKFDRTPDNQQVLAESFHDFLTSNPNFWKETVQRHLEEVSNNEESICEDEEEAMSDQEDSPRGPSRKALLRALDFDVDGPGADIQECQRLQYDLDPSAKDEATFVIHSKEFKRWLKKKKSSSLLVCGNRPDLAMEDISPVSLVSAELVSLFSLSKSAVVLGYFCGLHADSESFDDWISEMMKSLICQLLAQPKNRHLKFDLSFIDEDMMEHMRINNFDELCRVFRKLVQQLPSDKMLFCVLDAVSRFEVSPQAEMDAIVALGEIVKLTRTGKGITMKVLLTSPSDSAIAGEKDMGKDVIVDRVLVVPDSVDGGEQGSWNTSSIEQSVVLS